MGRVHKKGRRESDSKVSSNNAGKGSKRNKSNKRTREIAGVRAQEQQELV